MNSHKKIYLGIAIIIITLTSATLIRLAQANVFTEWWNDHVAPLVPENTAVRPAQSGNDVSPPELYKPVLDYEKAVIAAVKKASPSVVSITVSKNVPILENCSAGPLSDLPPEFQDFFGSRLPQYSVPCETGKSELQEIGGGSGFIVASDGLIVTNKHVVSDIKAAYTVFTNDGRKYEATILARDPLQDLALLKIDASDLSPVELGDSDSIELGQTAIAIGNALGEFRNTVSAGVVSGLARTVTAAGGGTTETIQGLVQTDAAINPGNSGGPLLNLRGQVIGINTAIVSGAQNIGFAIPINRAKRDIESVQRSGQIETPYLGVRYLMITSDVAIREKLPVGYGALVRGTNGEAAVAANSPAADAGIQTEDIILEINGRKLDESATLGNVISEMKVGDTVRLKVRRGGKEMELSAKLERRPG
jgi:serine protease Do